MERILECVANFSEGKNTTTLEAIKLAIQHVKDVQLLNRDAGATANRTVFTFAGSPEAVLEAAFEAIKAAVLHINMNTQKGIHPRIGAADVVPLIPIKGITMDETVEMARSLAQNVWEHLQLPVYLYDYAAKKANFVSLASIRKGGYESLQTRMLLPENTPDFGNNAPHKTAGAVAIGARKVMVAYNVNLSTTDISAAKHIAEKIRETGHIAIDNHGNKQHITGKFKKVKAIGWMIPEFGKAQVSMNIMDIEVSPLIKVFEEIKRMAVELGTSVSGSEVIGLIPLKCLEETADFINVDFKTNPEAVLKHLGLNDVKPFDASTMILEYAIEKMQ